MTAAAGGALAESRLAGLKTTGTKTLDEHFKNQQELIDSKFNANNSSFNVPPMKPKVQQPNNNTV